MFRLGSLSFIINVRLGLGSLSFQHSPEIFGSAKVVTATTSKHFRKQILKTLEQWNNFCSQSIIKTCLSDSDRRTLPVIQTLSQND